MTIRHRLHRLARLRAVGIASRHFDDWTDEECAARIVELRIRFPELASEALPPVLEAEIQRRIALMEANTSPPVASTAEGSALS
jgi:hypothetical protein